MVACAGAMLIQELADGGRLQVIEYVRLPIRQDLFHFLRTRDTKPSTTLSREATLWELEDRRWQECS